jgi:hypothetical protein
MIREWTREQEERENEPGSLSLTMYGSSKFIIQKNCKFFVKQTRPEDQIMASRIPLSLISCGSVLVVKRVVQRSPQHIFAPFYPK